MFSFHNFFMALFMGLSSPAADQPINNYLIATKEHVLIKGTNISMIPPTDFESSESFKGFQDPDDPSSMIMVVEIPGPFAGVTQGFTKEALSQKGMKLKRKKKVWVGDHEGMYIKLTQKANGAVYSKSILAYGNPDATTMINGVHLKKAKKRGKRIKRSVLSTFVDDGLEVDARKELGYVLDETLGELQFVSVIGKGMLFNRDLKTPTESEDKATLIVDNSYAVLPIENKKKFCVDRLGNYPDDYQLLDEKGIVEIEIDGLRGFELYAQNTTDKNEEMYQVILFKEEGGYVIFVGTYLTDSQKAVSDIKNVVNSFQRK